MQSLTDSTVQRVRQSACLQGPARIRGIKRTAAKRRNRRVHDAPPLSETANGSAADRAAVQTSPDVRGFMRRDGCVDCTASARTPEDPTRAIPRPWCG